MWGRRWHFIVSALCSMVVLSTAYTQNLLQNPGFEYWTAGMPDYWVNETGGFDVVKDSNTVHGGSYSAKLRLKSKDTRWLTQYVFDSIFPGDGYEFSFYVYDNDPYGKVRVAMRWYDGSGDLISGYYGDHYSSDSTDWQQLKSGIQIAPSGAETLHVEIRLYDVAWGDTVDSAILYVDDAYLKRFPNLLQNPGFESWTAGMPDYWVNETGGFDVIKDSNTVYDGNYSAKLILKSTATQRFTQYVDISPGYGYEFSFYVYDNDPHGKARIAMRWYDGSGTFIDGYYGGYSSNDTTWQYLTSGIKTAPSNAEILHVEIRLYDVNWDTTVDSAVLYVDNAYLGSYGPTFVEESHNMHPSNVLVLENPARSDVELLLSLEEPAEVTFAVYDVTGRVVQIVNMGRMDVGTHRIAFNGDKLSAGVYFLTLNVGDKIRKGRFILLK